MVGQSLRVLNETLRSYTKRFTVAYFDVTNQKEDFAIHAFKVGVTNENVHYAFCGTDIMNIEGLITKAQKLAEAKEMRIDRTSCS